MEIDNSEDFVTNFYNLQGDTIAERKKNFFRLLRAQTTAISEEDLTRLQPRTYLESLFEIEIFIHFKILAQLREVIKGGNEIFISKILKHPLVLKEVIGDIPAETFVNEFLPCTSYTIRLKILHRISFILEESQMDMVVTCVHKRYGFYIATKILHTCSLKMIEYYLSNYELTLKPRQIKYIFEKHPEFLIVYLNNYKSNTGKVFKHKNLSNYVASKNPTQWLLLYKEKLINPVSFGRRTSKKYMKDNSRDVCNNVEYYSSFLKLEVIVRKLQGYFKDVYLEYFPKEANNISKYSFSHVLLKHYPKKRRWDIFAQTFTKVFQSDILDNLKYLNSNFVCMFPTKTVVNKWGEVHYNECKSDDFLKYCEPCKAIPLIKEKINVTSNISDRTKYIKILLENCKINEDLTSLEAVLKYISYRHRNEDTIANILREILILYDTETFNESHWIHINEIIKFLKVKQNICFICLQFQVKYLEYLLLNKKPYREELLIYIKEALNSRYSLLDLFKNPVIAKQLYTEIINIFPEVVPTDCKKFEEMKDDFIISIINFNLENPENCFDLSNFPDLYTRVEKLLHTTQKKLEYSEKVILTEVIEYNFKYPNKPIIPIEHAQILTIFYTYRKNFYFFRTLEKIVAKLNRSKFENDVLQFFWDNLSNIKNSFSNIIKWFLKNEPQTIAPYINQLIKVNQSGIDMRTVKLMSHLSIDKDILEYCMCELKRFDDFLEKVKNKDTMSSSSESTIKAELEDKIKLNVDTKVIEIMSLLLCPNDYIEIVSKRFLPSKMKLDPKDEEMNEIYPLQCEVVKSFKGCHEPAKVLPTLIKYCSGDYLKYALPSLYSVCYRTPEQLLHPHLELLLSRAVSVRKHAIFLSCEVSDYAYAVNKLINSNESHTSSQKHVFSTTQKYFRKNPSDELLNLVIANLNKININDRETLNSLINLNIPKKFSLAYIQQCWYFYESLREKEVYVSSYLELLLNFINKSDYILASLPVNFFHHIFSCYFKYQPEADHYLKSIHRFACLVLRQQNEQQISNFKYVFDIVATFKNEALSVVEEFFQKFHDIACNDIKNNHKINAENNYYIELFKQHWYQVFTATEMFNQHVLLTLLYLQCHANDLEKYTKEVVLYLEQLIIEYGPYIYCKFKDLFIRSTNINDQVLFCYNILQFKNTTLNCIFVLDIIPDTYDGDKKEIYDLTKQILKSSVDPVVSVYYNSYFKY